MSLSQPDLLQLHRNIIDYLTKRSRIMSCHKLKTWNDFIAYYNYLYSDYSREDLRREFLTTILPKVFTYNLTNIQRRKIEIFGTHNQFSRSEEGFREVLTRGNLPIEGKDFARSDEDAKLHGLSCIVTQSLESRGTSNVDVKISAWTSAINSTDDELASNCLHQRKELLSRVTDSKEIFKATGQVPPNLTPAISKKIIDYRNQAEKLSSCIVPVDEK